MRKTVLNQNSNNFRRVYNWITAISLLIAGACLISGSLHIYFGLGEYTREAVGDAFSLYSLPIFICLALALIGVISEFFAPTQESPAKAHAYVILLCRLKAKKDINSNSEIAHQIEKEEKSRKTRSLILSTLILISALIFLTYVFVQKHWENGELITASVIKASIVLGIQSILPISLAAYFSHLDKKSVIREIELLKTLENKEKADEAVVKGDARRVKIIRICLIVLALTFIVFGIFANGTADVLAKAKAICTECVGLG
ncbi:MAG: hypothetical protein IKT34_01650 [Clostridia bacterium]|nr:hypothetical protein [Clostridia bacterium]